jgi:hypothetical protein
MNIDGGFVPTVFSVKIRRGMIVPINGNDNPKKATND